MSVTGKKFQADADCKEAWYGTEYSCTKLSEDVLQTWSSAGLNDKLRLPEKNEFIPSSFDLLPLDQARTASPAMIRDTKMTRLWYRQDDKFQLPKAHVKMQLTSPFAYKDPLSTNLAYMFCQILSDALTEYTHAAELAGLGYEIYGSAYGIVLELGGYNDKQRVLLQKLMTKMMTLEIDEKRYDILLENFHRGLKNFRTNQPYMHALYYTDVVTEELKWTNADLIEAFEETTIVRLREFIPCLFSAAHIEMLVYGNVSDAEALELADIVESSLENTFHTVPLKPSQRRRFREFQLPDKCYYAYQQSNDVHSCSALEVYYQCSVIDTHDNMVLELFCQIISEPCFDILRTQEQLGYVVCSRVRRKNGVQGLDFVVQSDKSPEYAEARVEAFLQKMKSSIEEMTDEVFQKHVNALAVQRMEKPKKMSHQCTIYWAEITNQLYHFNRDEMEVDYLKTLTREDVLKFYQELIDNDAPRRHKLSVYIVSTTNNSSGETSTDQLDSAPADDPNSSAKQQATVITNVGEFKQGLQLHRRPKPFIDVDPAYPLDEPEP